MQKLRIAMFIGLLVPALQASAQVYKCVDEAGKTVYLQSPCPPGQSSKLIVRKATQNAPSPAPSAKSAPSAETQFRKRQSERLAAEQKESDLAAETTRKQEDCQRARQQASLLESGRMVGMNKGERYFLDDAQVAQEKQRTQALITELCK